MFVFLGSYNGGGGGSSDNNDSQDEGSTDDHIQTGVDDFSVGDEGSDESGQGSSTRDEFAGGTGGSAGGGGGGSSVIVEPLEGEDSGDGDEANDVEGDEEEKPESPNAEEPDPERDNDVDESDKNEDDMEEEEADDDEDEDDEKDDTVVVVQEVDALSAMSWVVQPVMKHVEECYGEEIELFYKPAPVRELNPEQERQKWIDAGQQVSMPVDPSVWNNDPPESTELVNKAFEAAIQQRRGVNYIRKMWRHGVAEGRDISDREALINLASDLGLDLERFEKDLNDVEVKTGDRGELPFTSMEIQGKQVPKNGRLRYSDFRTQFTFQGIEEEEPQQLQDFVQEHGPVATPEVMEVYSVQRQEAVQRLEKLEEAASFEVGGERFWAF